MKTILMNYCTRAYAAAMACEAYASAVGYQLGYTEPRRYMKNSELAKFQKKLVFPPQLGLLPVAVFTVGVTYRLVTARICSAILRVAIALDIKANENAGPRNLPETRSEDRERASHDDSAN